MTASLLDPGDPPERQTAKLLRMVEVLMRRVEQAPDPAGLAYAQFERAAMLEAEVRDRTEAQARTLDLLNESNARLSDAMREAEAARSYLSEAIETIEEGFALFDAADRLVLHNSRFCRGLPDVAAALAPGLAFDEYVARVSRSDALALPAGEGAEEWRARRMRRHGDDRTTFDVHLTDDRWIQVSEHRTGAGDTVILQTDVTPIVRRERRARERALDRHQRMTRATLDHLAQGVCTFDRTGRLVGWNAQMREILGRPLGAGGMLEEGGDEGPAEALAGLPFAELLDRLEGVFRFDGDVDRDVLEAWAARRKGRRPLALEVTRADGAAPEDLRTFALAAREIPGRGFVISFTDLTAERAAARALRDLAETLERRVAARTEELGAALDEARRADAARTRFMAAAGHDLLQPLSAAKLFASALEDRAADEGGRDLARKAVSALHSVETMIEALLDITRLESGRAEVTIEPVPLGDLLARLGGEMAPLAAARGIELAVVPSTLRVESDAVYLRRVVQNLIANAIRHSDGPRVLVGVRRVAGAARIEVLDQGPGIAAEDRSVIFQEFRQLGPHRSGAGGLGLGLAIAAGACRMLGHALELRSEPGRGSCFSVTAHLARGGAGAEAPGPRPQPGAGEAPALDGLVVLLVENDEDVARGVSLTIEGWGSDVLHAETGEAAARLLDELGIEPDALLLDYQLGDGMDGLATLEALRERHGDLPARIISADRSEALRARCAEAGVALLPKPLSRADLVEFLETVRLPG
jgi:signal transduction histidine kinase